MRGSGLSFSLLGLVSLSLALLAHAYGPQSVRISSSAHLNAAPISETRPATELEWVPPLPQSPGVVEQTLQRILLPVQPLKSAPTEQPIRKVESEMFLPPEAPSLNLNLQTVGADKAAPNDIPIPVVVPPMEPVMLPVEMPPPVVPVQEMILPSQPQPNDPPPPANEPIVPPILVTPTPDTPITQPGEATMKSIKFAMSAILGAALLSAPAKAAEPADDLKKTVERLEAAIKKLEMMEPGLTEYKLSNSSAVKQVQVDVEALKSRLQSLERDLNDLRLATNPATTSKRDTGATSAKGILKLSNDYSEEMSIVVNGVDSYRLLPGQTRTVQINPGPFTYQVLQLQRNVQERMIAPGEEKPIRIYTQRN